MKAKLVMFKRDGQRKDFGITHDRTLIGRAEDCDFQIPLLSVSRHHCEMIKSDDELRIRDLSSSNGTYVNNQRVNEKALKAGDRLTVGPVVFTVQIDGAPEQIRPVTTKIGKAAVAATTEEEEVVNLQADSPAGEDADPIAALEALAAEAVEEKKEQEEKE